VSIHLPEYSHPPPELLPRSQRILAIYDAQLRNRAQALNFVLLGLIAAVVLATVVLLFYLADLAPEFLGLGASSATLFFVPWNDGVWFFFLILLTSSVGAGIVAGDLATRALTLYLARPISRLDYLVAKAGAVATWVAFGAIVPPLIATFIVLSLGYTSLPIALQGFAGYLAVGLLAVAALTGVAVLLSTLSSRSALAGAGIFGTLLGSEAVAALLAAISKQASFGYLSPFQDLVAVASAAFGQSGNPLNPWAASALLVGLAVSTFALAFLRLQRAEVISE
jgi:ABC-type transport system involved in multi-copper enzyme maturation permease subunit